MFSFSPGIGGTSWYGSGRIYDDIRFEPLHHINRRLSVQEDIKVVQTGSHVLPDISENLSYGSCSEGLR